MKDAGKLIQVDGPVWMVLGENRGRFPRSHSTLIRDRETVLIDTGPGVKVLEELSRTVAIDRVINTHTHPDHSAGNFLFGDLEIIVPELGFESSGDLWRLSERFFEEPEIQSAWRAFVRREMDFRDQRPTGAFAPDEMIEVGDTKMRVVPAPGHSADHSCLWLPELEILIGADIDLTPFGPWYGHPECDLDQLRRSIARAKELKPRIVVSSHRPPVRTGVEAALDRFAAVLDRREAKLVDFLAAERSWEEIVEAALVYGRFPYEGEIMRAWEGQMIGMHLAELLERGEVLRTDHGFRSV